MLKSTVSKQMWAGRPAAFVVALLTIVVAALLAATPAWASSPSDVSVQFFKSDKLVSTTYAGEKVGYQVSFTATSALFGISSRNDSITISAPAGTVFPAGGYSLDNGQETYIISNKNVVLSDGGSTVTLNLVSNEFVEAGDRVRIIIGVVTNPSEPGQYTLDVHTSRDTTPATSAPYTILPALIGGEPPVPTVPTAKEQCKKGGYEEFGFRNQGQCVAFVQRGSKN